jgi:hypothetical protein
MEIAVEVLLACSPAMPENGLMTLRKYVNSLGLQVQSVVSREFFPQE